MTALVLWLSAWAEAAGTFLRRLALLFLIWCVLMACLYLAYGLVSMVLR